MATTTALALPISSSSLAPNNLSNLPVFFPRNPNSSPSPARLARPTSFTADGDGAPPLGPYAASPPRSRAADSSSLPLSSVLTYQKAVQRLQEYWASVGCSTMQCSNTEVGAGTMNPLTFLRVLGPEPWNVAYVEPSIRPDDSRYGDNPNRLQRHTQFQVILKPDPGNSQDLFINSLSALGINVKDHDIRFVEDNWESPAGSLPLQPVSVEITYGLERILMLLQGVDHFKKIQYSDEITYGELFLENEKEMSAYYLEYANVDHILKSFNNFEEEAQSMLSHGLAIPAYDQLLKTSHAFNILDSRGFVGVTERARYFSRMRSLARQCAQLWVNKRESLQHPLGSSHESDHYLQSKEPLLGQTKKLSKGSRVFVLEIGTEEMPAHDVVDGSQQLKVAVTKLLDQKRLSYGEVLTCGTPRRLVIYVDKLSAKQIANDVEIRGPPATKAFTDDGCPTKAAEGFCRKYSVSVDCLYKKFDGKVEYVYIKIVESSESAVEVLAEDLPSVIAKISFPMSMRWNSQVMFSRPIRWILALHGNCIVPFEFSGVSCGNLSCGLRNSSSATIEVGSAEEYVDAMKNAGILIQVEERKNKILNLSTLLAESVGGHLIVDSLLQEVSNLVEAPVPILGKFDESFLELPKEILILVMQKHQKYFPITDRSSGKILPYFVSVANGFINKTVVREGNEAVLRARYEDAKFFYNMDIQKNLIDFRKQLSGILFHEKLGTILDKTTRIEKTVSKLSIAFGMDESILLDVQNAAALAMSDLATSVVSEFTSLSGVMARHYALKSGYSEQIAEALFEIVVPRFSGDVIPKSEAGIILAIADRLDSLVGLFAAGCQPSSTNDPFGLRRIAYGLVQILVENNMNLDFRWALRIAAEVQPIEVNSNILENVHHFVSRRLEQLLVDRGIRSEIVRSVLLERANSPSIAAKSAIKMEALSKGDFFPKVIEAYSRPTRIIRGKDVDVSLEVNPDAFQTNEERVLWNTFMGLQTKIHPGVEVDAFVEVSSQLIQPLENFFNNVYVMAEDEKLRKNRLALLKKIADLTKGIADLSVLPGF